MSDQIWVLLSVGEENQTPSKSLERIYWDPPTVEDLKYHFNISPMNYYMDALFNDLINGLKAKLYGAEYWIQSFNRIKNDEHEKSNAFTDSSHGYLVG